MTRLRFAFYLSMLLPLAGLFTGCPSKPVAPTNTTPTELTLSPKDAQTGAPGANIRWTAACRTGEGGTQLLVLKATLDPGWTIFSLSQDNADGPSPTVIALTGSNARHVGEPTEVGSTRLENMDETFGMPLVRFQGEVSFTQAITVSDPGQPVTGTLTYDLTNGTDIAHHVVDFAVPAIQ